MKPALRYKDLDWQIWLLVWLSIVAGLAGVREAYYAHALLSVLNLGYYIVRDKSITSFPVQVREVWMAFALAALWPPAWWLFILMLLGLAMYLLFDRCLIVRTLIKMPWNKGVVLK